MGIPNLIHCLAKNNEWNFGKTGKHRKNKETKIWKPSTSLVMAEAKGILKSQKSL